MSNTTRTTRTVYGSQIQTQLLLGLPYTHVANSTLNEKFNVNPGVLPDNNSFPHLRYFCIGNGGHRNVAGADGFPLTAPQQHRASDAALFNHLPFLIREVGNDLDPTTRQNYALRKLITAGGNDYIAYYLKRLNMDNVQPSMKNNVVVDGVVTSSPFVPTSANLNPTAPVLPPSGAVTTTGDYLSTSANLDLNFTADDVAEVVEACRILFDNELYAVISEIGLVAGADKIVTTSVGVGQSFNYNECVCATITTHLIGHYPVAYTNEGFQFSLEVGATEPLFGIADLP